MHQGDPHHQTDLLVQLAKRTSQSLVFSSAVYLCHYQTLGYFKKASIARILQSFLWRTLNVIKIIAKINHNNIIAPFTLTHSSMLPVILLCSYIYYFLYLISSYIQSNAVSSLNPTTTQTFFLLRNNSTDFNGQHIWILCRFNPAI